MKKILCFCASSYQILVANKIIDQFYPDDEIHLIIADTISNAEEIYTNALKITKYKEVYLWKIKGEFNYNKALRIINASVGWPLTKKILNCIKPSDEVFDVYLFSNFGLPMLYLGYSLKHNNSKMVCEMFEDGFNTYSKYYGDYLNRNRLSDKITRRFFKKIETIYLFNPEILEWEPKCNVKKLSTSFHGELLERINHIFDYKTLEDDYDKKCIFFEESYYADGQEIDDVDIVEAISNIIPKNEIMIKIHPRNQVNRFKKMGYVTNKNLSIPWEVIVLNQEFNHTIFATVASNAAMNPYFLFGKMVPSILLFKCVKLKENLRTKIVEFDNNLCSRYPEVFYIPENTTEMNELLVNIMRGCTYENNSYSTNETK